MTLTYLIIATVLSYSGAKEFRSTDAETPYSKESVTKSARTLQSNEWRIHGCWTDHQLLEALQTLCPEWVPFEDVDYTAVRCWSFKARATCHDLRYVLHVEGVGVSRR